MLRVSDIMVRSVLLFARATPLSEALRALVDADVSGAPVCEADGRVIGVIAKSDLAELSLGGAAREAVGDLMSSDVISAKAGEALGVAIERMVFEGVHRLIVIDDEGRLVGIMTASDVLRAIAEGRATLRAAEAPASVRHPREVGERTGPGTPSSSTDS